MDTSTGHRNYMNGISYFPDNPINRLMMVGCKFFPRRKGYYNPDSKRTYHVNTCYNLDDYLLFKPTIVTSLNRKFFMKQ